MKHGGDQQRVGIDVLEESAVTSDEILLLMNEALTQLEWEDPQRGRVVILRG